MDQAQHDGVPRVTRENDLSRENRGKLGAQSLPDDVQDATASLEG